MYLERGTRHIKARNFWRDAIRRNRSKLGPMLERETRQAENGRAAWTDFIREPTI